MHKITFVLILVLVLALLATGFSRNMEMSFEGDIEYVSTHGSNIAESVVHMEGNGSGELTQEASGGNGSFNHSASVEVEGVETTVGLKTPQGVYVTQVSPEPGETGLIEQEAEVSNDEFAQLIYGAESAISYGLYQRHIDMQNEEVYVREVLELFGMGWTRDFLQFGIDDAE